MPVNVNKLSLAWFRLLSVLWLLTSLFFSNRLFAAETEVPAFKRLDVQTSSRQTNVILEFTKPIGTQFRSFSTVDPARVIIDLPTIKNVSGKTNFDAVSPDVRSVSVVSAEAKSRIVINLRQSMDVEVIPKGNQLQVQMRSNPTLSPGVGQTTGDSVVQASGVNQVDFRRGKEGEGRLVIDFSGTDIRPELKTESGQLVLDLHASPLASGLQKILDVADFGTPVKTVTTRQTASGVQVRLETNGFWEHATFQENRRLTVDVRPLSTDPTRSALLSKSNQFRGERISLNFQNADVRSLLQVFAEFTNLNIIASDSVSGNITLRLKNVPWDQAMDIVLKSKGLDVRQNGSVLLVAPAAELAQREQADLTAKSQLSDLEPLRMESFALNYQKADDVVTLLTNERQRILSRRGSAVRDSRTNQVFVQDVAERLDQVRRLITRLDVPVRQVMIEARVVIAESTFGQALGARLGVNDVRGVADPGQGSGSKFLGNTYTTIGGSQGALANTTGQLGAPAFPATPASTNMVNLPAQSVNGFTPASFALSLFDSRLTKFINLELSALEAEGKGKVISSPRVITADQVKALIEQGTEFPYNTSAASGGTTVAFRKANLKLEVTPQITPEGGVIMDVDITKDSRGETVPAGVAINTKHVQTKVLVENGGTVVIGGIFEQEDKNDIVKTPFFGDLPYVGMFFRNQNKSTQKRELMVFLTPRVLTGQASR